MNVYHQNQVGTRRGVPSAVELWQVPEGSRDNRLPHLQTRMVGIPRVIKLPGHTAFSVSLEIVRFDVTFRARGRQ